MSTIMSNNISNVTNSLGKVYLATIMGLYMVLIEIAMRDMQYGSFNVMYYSIFGGLLIIFIYFYRVQYAIKDRQYLEEMIEHHSMALLTSQEILKKTDSYNVSKLAKNIIQTQTDEILEMRNLLKSVK
jgi:tyrosine-protein phosphatase YwqE